MGFRQETALEIMAEMCRQAGYANSTELNQALNDCLKILIATSDDFKANPGGRLRADLEDANVQADQRQDLPRRPVNAVDLGRGCPRPQGGRDRGPLWTARRPLVPPGPPKGARCQPLMTSTTAP